MPFSRKKPEIQVGLSGTALKYIAMATMLADHIGAVLLERIVYYRGNLEQVAMLMTSQWGDTLYWLWRMLRTVGRIAFPIYCFLLVEGFLHTRDWRRYWLRMAAFALISEIPFRLAVWNTWAGGSSNVYVELAIGLLVLRGLKQSEGLTQPRRRDGGRNRRRMSGRCVFEGGLRHGWDTDYLIVLSPAGEAHCPGDVRRYPVFTGILEYMLWGRDSVCCSPVFLQRKKGTGTMEIRLLLVLPAAFNGTVFHTAVCGRNSSRIIPGHAGLKRTKLFWFAQGIYPADPL